MLCPTSLTYKLVGHSEGKMNKLLHLPLEAEQSLFLMACQKHKIGTKCLIQPIQLISSEHDNKILFQCT